VALAWLVVAVALAAIAGCRAGVTRGRTLYNSALESLAAGDTAAATHVLQGAMFAAPKNAAAHYLLGMLRARRGTMESRAQAEKELRVAVDLAPGEEPYYAALGEVSHDQGFSHQAQTSLLTAVKLNPAQGRAWHILGLELLDEYREDSSPALRDSTLLCFEMALDSDATNSEARWNLALLLLERGQAERARAVARRGFAHRACPGPWGVLLAGIELLAYGFETGPEPDSLEVLLGAAAIGSPARAARVGVASGGCRPRFGAPAVGQTHVGLHGP
jgi:hypothetical protein